MVWRASVITSFPEIFPGSLDYSLIGQARLRNIWSLDVFNLRDYGKGKRRSIDDTVYGGGQGMILRCDVANAAINEVRSKLKDLDKEASPRRGGIAEAYPLIYLSPRGKLLDQEKIRILSSKRGIILLCNRYEGIDQRIIDSLSIEELSIGDYILSGGELAAMIVIDSCVRLLSGVISNVNALLEESFNKNLLEYSHYTRPFSCCGLEVPKVLTSGDHGKIREWRLRNSEELTKSRRPDLWEKYLESRAHGRKDN